MHKHPVGIVGASGYSGMEATRLLAAHPRVELRFVTGDRFVGDTVAQRAGAGGPAGQRTYAPQDSAVALAAGCEVVLLATPAEASMELVPKLLDAGVRVVDLSGAFRLADASAYPKWYGFQHRAPELLAEAVYGLPELFRQKVAGSRLVANPGCYPTAAALPLFPLMKARLVEPGSIVVNAASGVTGAGRKASEEYGFCEVDADFRAYRVLRHQHTPEMAQTIGAPVTFTPHLLPVKRGILCTTFAHLRQKADASAVRASLADAYRAEPFVELVGSAEEVGLKQVVGTNRCRIGFACEGAKVVLVSAIDNLVKGAAGQAVQNLNLLLGLDEGEGLLALRAFHP